MTYTFIPACGDAPDTPALARIALILLHLDGMGNNYWFPSITEYG